jgi:hypothetical protein
MTFFNQPLSISLVLKAEAVCITVGKRGFYASGEANGNACLPFFLSFMLAWRPYAAW